MTHVVVENTPEMVGRERLKGAAVNGLGVMPPNLEGDGTDHGVRRALEGGDR